jgi:O-acetyl-ADP-ribose deacetylase
LLAECRTLGGCPTGSARITKGHRLAAKHVIHTVGPIYRGSRDDAELLASCYAASLALVEQHGLKTVAFPCISTGVYGYPPHEACRIAVTTVAEWLQGHAVPEAVSFCCFLESDLRLYERECAAIAE